MHSLVCRHSMGGHCRCSLSAAAAPTLFASRRLCVFNGSPSPAVPSSSTRVHSRWYDGDDNRTDRDDGFDGPSRERYRDRGSSRRDNSSSSSSSRGHRDEAADWACLECGSNNFARNTSCRSCDAPRPEGVGGAARPRLFDRERYEGQQSYLDGDWECWNCGAHNSAHRTTCFSCGEPGDVAGSVSAERAQQGSGRRPYEGRTKAGGRAAAARPPRLASAKLTERYRNGKEWDCPSCGTLNFARRIVCYTCKAPAPAEVPRPQPVLVWNTPEQRRDGDWNCPGCGELNFERRGFCRRCGTAVPGGGGAKAARGRQEPTTKRPAQKGYVAKEGDWTCGECGNVNYAFRRECKKCGAQKA